MMWPEGESRVQRAIALAFRHPVGVGNARWHLGNYRGYAEATYVGTFRKRLFDEVGFYDTNCRANQDGELYLRILKAGGRIFLDSSIRVVYFPRPTLRGLARQYFRYGKGRAYTSWKHRRMTSWRQAGPPALVAGLLGSVGLAVGTGEPGWLLVPGGYGAGLLAAAVLSWRKGGAPKKSGSAGEHDKIGLKTRFLVAASWAVMHLSWGVGFLYNFPRLVVRPRVKAGHHE